MDVEKLKQEFPPIFTRQVASRLLGGAMSAGTLANLDSAGEGPDRAFLGGKIVYERESFFEWLTARIKRRAGFQARV